MEDEAVNIAVHRSSTRIRKVAPKMNAALASADNRTQAALARLDALENDNAAVEVVVVDDDEDASLDEDEQVFVFSSFPRVHVKFLLSGHAELSLVRLVWNASTFLVKSSAGLEPHVSQVQAFGQKKQSRGSKRRTRQAKALEIAKKAPRNFMELLQEANLEALPAHVPTYLRAAVGPPSSTARRHFCSVCGYIASYTCVQCGARFCSCRCQVIHTDTRCMKFVA